MEKYYSVEDAIKMLPLITAYCKDIKRCHHIVRIAVNRLERLSSLTSLDEKRKNKIKKIKERIHLVLKQKANIYKRWKEELQKLHIKVCHAPTGRVDIPVYSALIEAVVTFCVTPETSKKSIEWHGDNQTYESAKPYFEKVF